MTEMFSNNFDDFEFHDVDARFKADGEDMIFTLHHLNVHKNTVFNPFDCDMEADTAMMKLCSAELVRFKYPAYSTEYPDGTAVYMPDIVVPTDRALETFMSEAENGIRIHGVARKEGCFMLEASGANSFIDVEIAYTTVEIVWNRYVGKAWYEQNEFNNLSNT